MEGQNARIFFFLCCIAGSVELKSRHLRAAKELRHLLRHMVESTEQTIESLEKIKGGKNTNISLCANLSTIAVTPATLQNLQRNPKAFHLYLRHLNHLTKAHKLQSLPPRIRTHFSHDIALGIRIRQKMKSLSGGKWMIRGNKIKCEDSDSRTVSISLPHAFLKAFRNLKKISKSLLKERFENFDKKN